MILGDKESFRNGIQCQFFIQMTFDMTDDPFVQRFVGGTFDWVVHFISHAIEMKDDIVCAQGDFLIMSKTLCVHFFNETQKFGFDGIE